MDIEKVVNEKFAEVVASGFVEEQIKTTLQKTIESAIRSSLESYSAFGKQLIGALSTAVSTANIDFPDYNQLVSHWVMDMVEKSMIQVGRPQIEATLKKFFEPLEKPEWKVSEIVQKFIEGIKGNDPAEEGEITCIIDTSDRTGLCPDYWAIYLDEDSNKGKFQCKYQIHVNRSGVWRVEIDGDDSRESKFLCLYGFDSFVFKLYSNKVQIINDESFVETSYGNDD